MTPALAALATARHAAYVAAVQWGFCDGETTEAFRAANRLYVFARDRQPITARRCQLYVLPSTQRPPKVNRSDR
jgi:hypothetical protein